MFFLKGEKWIWLSLCCLLPFCFSYCDDFTTLLTCQTNRHHMSFPSTRAHSMSLQNAFQAAFFSCFLHEYMTEQMLPYFCPAAYKDIVIVHVLLAVTTNPKCIFSSPGFSSPCVLQIRYNYCVVCFELCQTQPICSSVICLQLYIQLFH